MVLAYVLFLSLITPTIPPALGCALTPWVRSCTHVYYTVLDEYTINSIF